MLEIRHIDHLQRYKFREMGVKDVLFLPIPGRLLTFRRE